jgi:hypothetical protein
MRIWCIKTGILLVLHSNPLVSAGGLLVAEGLYSPVAKYFGTCLKYEYELNCREKSKRNLSKNKELSPSCIALSFNGFGSNSLHFVWCFGSFNSFFFFFTIYSDFQLQPEHHWRDFISRNAHTVHQNWYRISFTLMYIVLNEIQYMIVFSIRGDSV